MRWTCDTCEVDWTGKVNRCWHCHNPGRMAGPQLKHLTKVTTEERDQYRRDRE